ncbi:MAG: undecaprenyl-phosphate glucose phosphotransferase, partial [Mesorhizobium sp.]
MNEIDPARRFSIDAVRKFDGPASGDKLGGMNDVARQVASQYRRDTMSPIMVSGVLRMVEFALLFLSGLCVYFYHVGF